MHKNLVSTRVSSLLRLLASRSRPALTLLTLLIATLHAQATTGAIEGRVAHASTGRYLVNVRLTVEGTALETFTDGLGAYRLDGVPAGQATLKAFFTGLKPFAEPVPVTGGQVAIRDVTLDAFTTTPTSPTATGAVQLDAFVVATKREMDAAALAINEQRFAASVKNVVSTDEFGAVAEGNIGEFLKFLPGVSVDYVGGNARSISINGVPPDNVPVTLGGLSMASSSGDGGRGRSFNMDFFSTNNLSRVEIEYSPTPESSGSALAGTVNLVPRSAFERTNPLFNYSVSALMRDNNKSLRATPGPRGHVTNKIRPGPISAIPHPSINPSATPSRPAPRPNFPRKIRPWRSGGEPARLPTAARFLILLPTSPTSRDTPMRTAENSRRASLSA